ncbi:MAG: cupin domain-containing protein [Desulfovibrio sp.]|uniref:cupin domain-containing protein n=1 Tax=Desulfovibrio sp. 7SRBS1 TaxID=3378064 RepID=UPI003B3D7F6C
MKTCYADIVPYITKDASEIRELMHPGTHCVRKQSLAEAKVGPGKSTEHHVHMKTEELYHVTSGAGEMRLGDETFPISPKDTVLIPPGTPHSVRNTGNEPLVMLCCCAPAYAHEDTTLV